MKAEDSRMGEGEDRGRREKEGGRGEEGFKYAEEEWRGGERA